jgi:hypothetical protein
MQSLQSAAAAGERVFEFLEAEELSDESSKTKMPARPASVKNTEDEEAINIENQISRD